MAVQDKKISALATWAYTSINAAATIVVALAADNYQIALSTLKQYVLENKEIGGVAAGSVVTNNASQTLSNKALSNPDINGTIVSVTGENINHLSGLSENVQSAIDNLTHDMSVAESHIDAVEEKVDALQADKIYSTSRAAASTSIYLAASEIGGGEEIDAHSLSISVYIQTSTLSMRLVNLSNINISYAMGTPPSSKLTNVTIGDVDTDKIYHIIIRYRVAA